MPPLVTISSAGRGAAALQLAPGGRTGTRARSRSPAPGVYCSATAASSRTSRAAISSTSSGRERRRVREPAGHRQHAGRAAGEDRGRARRRRAGACGGRRRREVRHRPGSASALVSPAVERRDVLVVVGEVVQRLAAGLRRRGSRARRARSPRRSRARPRSGSAAAISSPSSSPKTMSPGATPTPPQVIVAPRAARDTVVPERGVVPRANTGNPIRRSPRRSRQ